jgi:hypothetical protein
VFRKLEQNVRRFKQVEEDPADALELTGDDRERAGAMIVGRFETAHCWRCSRPTARTGRS